MADGDPAAGRATTRGTKRFADRFQKLPGHFRRPDRLAFSSLALGTRNGEVGGIDDMLYRSALATVLEEGHAQVRAQLQLETDLRRALAQNQFDVFYQPIVSLPSGVLAGFEALVRWHHPERGLVTAREFMPMAEETGLVHPIGHRVLVTACRQMKEWNDHRAPQEPVFVSVNLSNRQLSEPDLVAETERVLAATGLGGDRLFVEVTESAVMADPETVLEALIKLKRLGVRVSLDDFGSGTSSLSVLHRFPFDRIKIDPWFVRNIGVDRDGDELIEGILALCHGKRFDTVAEGVETQEQRQRLAELGCSFAQGFLFSEPVNKNRAEELMTTAPLGFG